MEQLEAKEKAQPKSNKESTYGKDTQEVRNPLFQKAGEPQVSCKRLRIHSLAPSEALMIKTRNSSYRIIMLDRTHQKVLIRGGTHFQQPTEACLLGSAVGRKIHVGSIVLGRGMGVSVGRRCFVTSPVEAIERQSSEGPAMPGENELKEAK
jgi:hypothetical protein